jgi:hypothetical protein
LLDATDINVLKCCYGALFCLSKFPEIGTFPVHRVAEHLDVPELVECVLPLILVCGPVVADGALLPVLVDLAEADERATLVLLKLAQRERNAEALMRDDSWLDLLLPTNADTLKLLFVLLEHSKLVRLIGKSRRLIPLFVRAVLDVDAVHMALLAGIFKRLRLTKSFVAELAETEFFPAFVKPDGECDWEIADRAMFDLFQTVARVTFVHAMLEVCHLACQQIETDGSACTEAGDFVITACALPKCREKLLELDVLAVYRAKQRKGALARQAAQIARLLRGAS